MSRRSLDCPICYCQYDNKEQYPVVLLCGHSFCSVCAKMYPNNQGTCPTCREAFRFPYGYIKNFSLLECLSLLNDEEKNVSADKRKGLQSIQSSGASLSSDQMAFIQELAHRLTTLEEENRATKLNLRYLMDENTILWRKLEELENVDELTNKLERMSVELSHQADSIEELQLFVAGGLDASNDSVKNNGITHLQNPVANLRGAHVLQEHLQQQNGNRVSMQLLQRDPDSEARRGTTENAPVPENKPNNKQPAKTSIFHKNLRSYLRPLEAKFDRQQDRKLAQFIGQWKLSKFERNQVNIDVSKWKIHRHLFERVPEGLKLRTYDRDGSKRTSCTFTTDKAILNKLDKKGARCSLIHFKSDRSFRWGSDTFTILGNTLLQSWSTVTLTYEKCS